MKDRPKMWRGSFNPEIVKPSAWLQEFEKAIRKEVKKSFTKTRDTIEC